MNNEKKTTDTTDKNNNHETKTKHKTHMMKEL